MLQILLSLVLSLIAMGCCEPRYVDFFPCHDDGRPKPKVAVIPMQDCTNANPCWNASCELTVGLRHEFMHSGELFLLSSEIVENRLSRMSDVDLFSKGIPFAKYFGDVEFVVLTEIIGYDDAANCPPPPPNNIRILVKVIDVRNPQCEKVILQEVFAGTYLFPFRIGTQCQPLTYLEPQSQRVSLTGKGLQEMVQALAGRIEVVVKTTR